jgi:uncharacterized protein
MKRLAWLLVLVPAAGHAAGIDCNSASSRIDRAICGSAALLVQDRLLAKNTQAVADAAQQDGAQFTAQARAWLAARDAACVQGETNCLLAQYQKRNLYLQILLDRIAGSELPLMSLAAARMTGTWTAGTVTMLSAADNKLGTPNVFPLDTASTGNPAPGNDFSASAYGQNNLPMPGAKITNRGDETCFTGGAFTPAGSSLAVSNDVCANFAWQPTDFLHLWTDMYGSHSQDPDARSDTEDFQIAPALIEADLGLTPSSTVFIGYVMLGNDQIPRPDLLVVPGKDGALYAPVMVPSADPSQKGFNVAYQKWSPDSADARMEVLAGR